MLDKLGKSEVSVEMGDIVGIGGQGTVIGKEIEIQGKNGKEKIDACLKFEEYPEKKRKGVEKKKKVKINGKMMENGAVFGKGHIRHLCQSTEFECASKVEHPNVIKILDFAITKTIFGDHFFCLGLSD